MINSITKIQINIHVRRKIMKEISFNDFIKDYREYYDERSKHISIRTEDDMQEVLFDIYDVENFEIDYENEIIELY
jgi:hypothetical protein